MLTGRTPESLTAELKQLRRGLGLYHPDLAKRLGPGLRDVCGVTDGDPDLRSKVITRLRDAAGTLPPELSMAAQAALGVHPETRALHKLEERVEWLARRLTRDVRTARRRMDDACAMLGEHLGAGRDGRRPSLPSTGWHIESAQSAVLLGDGPMAAYERRVVVAEHDGLNQLVLSRTVPPTESGGRPDVSGTVLFGGVLGIKEWASETRFQLVLDLPVTLRAGDRHEYFLLFQNPPDQPVRPYYVFYPVLRVDHFDLHVRFDRPALPERVFRVVDSFHRDLDEPPRDRDEIAVDPSGEVHVEFEHLAPGHGYGARWG